MLLKWLLKENGLLNKIMRILILGGRGMLGHRLERKLSQTHDVYITLRRSIDQYPSEELPRKSRVIFNLNIHDDAGLNDAIHSVKPEVILNCIGIIKQRIESENRYESLMINSVLPHRLAKLCRVFGARLIHFSTDCVFSGKRGGYTEDDLSDAEDVYGKTKYLGEVDDDRCMTIRTSIIGRELENKKGLIEWFIAQNGKTIKGYENAIFSGITTNELSNIVDQILVTHQELSGIWQVGANKINKYELLLKAKMAFGWKGDVNPFSDYYCDRSFSSERFIKATGYRAPSWDEMLEVMAVNK